MTLRHFRHLAVAATVLLATAPANAQRPKPAPEAPKSFSRDGTELFRALLNWKEIKPVKEPERQDVIHRHGDDVIVIILGSDHQARGDHEVTEVLAAGGAVLVASNSKLDLHAIRNAALIDSGSIRCDHPDLTLMGRPDYPFVVGVDRANDANPKSPGLTAAMLFQGDGKSLPPLDRVVAPNSAYIQASALDLNPFMAPLARFPRGSYAHGAVNKDGWLPKDAVFAVGGEKPRAIRESQFLAVASNRMFSNGVLYDKQTQNLEFCERMITYLQGQNPPRKRCLFFEEGRLIERFDDLATAALPPMPPMPIPKPAVSRQLLQKVVEAADKLLVKIQEKDVVNSLIDRFNGRTVLVGALAALACVLLLRRVLSALRPSNTPPGPVVVAASTGPPGVFERRQKELFRRDNLYEPVRDLVRDFFQGIGVHGEPGPKPPPLTVARRVRKPDSLRLAVKDFWKLAFGPPQTIAVNQWRVMEPYFDRLRQAHSDGAWGLAESPAGHVS